MSGKGSTSSEAAETRNSGSATEVKAKTTTEGSSSGSGSGRPPARNDGPVFTKTVWTWLVIFTVMALCIGSMNDESDIFTGQPSLPWSWETRIFFTNIFQRIANAMTPPYVRIQEQLLIAPLESAVVSIFHQLHIADAYIEQAHSKEWLTCQVIHARLHLEDTIDTTAFCRFLYFSSQIDLLEKHTMRKIYEGGHVVSYYSLSYYGAFLGEKHLHPLTHIEESSHQTLVSSTLTQGLLSSLKNKDRQPQNNHLIEGFLESYLLTLQQDPQLANCHVIAGAQPLTFPNQSSSSCILLKSVFPFQKTADINSFVDRARSKGIEVFAAELAHGTAVNHLYNRFIAASDLLLDIFVGPQAAASSSSLPPHLLSQSRSTFSPFVLIPLTRRS